MIILYSFAFAATIPAIAIRPWKQSLQDNERIHVLCEMYGVQLNKFEHHFDKIVESFDEKRENS